MDFKYELIRTKRKTIAIQVRPDGHVVVRAPLRMSVLYIERFVRDHERWIEDHVRKAEAQSRQQAQDPVAPLTDEQLDTLKRRAKPAFAERTAHFAPLIGQSGVSYGRITIRAQKSRWGSCSAAGNLNFNCLLLLAPPAVLDYVVVHELCHRLHMNHSPRFWAEVERVMPGYRTEKKWLRDNGRRLMALLPQ